MISESIPVILMLSFIFAQDLQVKDKCLADVVIGGLFPMKTMHSFDFKQNKILKNATTYERNNNTSQTIKTSEDCDGSLSAKGLQEAWAMLFAVDRINNNPNILTNVTLGVHIENSCDSEEIGIRSSMRFDFVTANNVIISTDSEKNTDFVNQKKFNASGQKENNDFPRNSIADQSLNLPKTVAVVGMQKSSISKSIATLTNLFGIPSVSYAATDTSLSDKTVYPLFVRTIPNDQLLVKMLITLIQKLKWNILFVVYDSSTDYGKSAFESFLKQLDNENFQKKKSERICLAAIIEFKSIEKEDDKFKDQLLSQPTVKGVLLFVHKESASTVLTRAFHENISDYTWIFTEGVDMTMDIRQMFKTKLTEMKIISCEPTNSNFFRSKLFREYKKFIEAHFLNQQAHRLIPITEQCIKENCMESKEFSFFIPYVIDAVNLVAYALAKRYNCAQGLECIVEDPRSLVSEMQNATFASALGYRFEFNQEGQVMGQYEIFKIEGKTKLERRLIGIWNSKDEKKIIIINLSRWIFSNSSCNSECSLGWGKIPTLPQDCCSICIKCKKDEYVNSDGCCESCPPFFTPTSNISACKKISEKILLVNEKISIALIVTATVGQLLVILVALTFIKYRHTHMIRASGKEMSYLMLLGNFLSFTTPYCVIEHPMEVACVLNAIVSSFASSLIVGPLVVKTNRIYRIFTIDVLYKGISKFVRTRWQRVIVSSIVLVQVGGSLATAFIKDPPLYLKHVDKDAEPYLLVECSFNINILSLCWVFQSLLIAACTYQAILARNVPANYNEARNIMLCMITMAIEWIVVLPCIHFGGISLFRKIMLPIINIMSATSTLLFIFAPRIYVVLFRPMKNKENLPHGKLGTITPKESRESRSNTSIRDSGTEEPCIKKPKLSSDT